MMAVDGADSTTLRETMEIAIGQEEEHGEDAAKVFEAAGGYAPPSASSAPCSASSTS